MRSPDEPALPADDKLYDEVVRPAVDAVATLDVDAEPAFRFAPLSRVDTRDTEDSDAPC